MSSGTVSGDSTESHLFHTSVLGAKYYVKHDTKEDETRDFSGLVGKQMMIALSNRDGG